MGWWCLHTSFPLLLEIKDADVSKRLFFVLLSILIFTYVKCDVYCSIGSILGCRAEILQLDVTDVKMDCF